MSWFQKEVVLRPRARGFHLITEEIRAQVPEIEGYEVGLAHLFILHTSASLALNENAAPDVRADMEAHFNRMVPEGAPYFRHTAGGAGRHARAHQGGAAGQQPVHSHRAWALADGHSGRASTCASTAIGAARAAWW